MNLELFERNIVKRFRVSKSEEEKIVAEMKQSGETNFSDFVRKKLLAKNSIGDSSRLVQTFLRGLEVNRIEKIYQEVLKLSQLSIHLKQSNPETIQLLLTFMQDLVEEVDKNFSLSSEFKQKYLGETDD